LSQPALQAIRMILTSRLGKDDGDLLDHCVTFLPRVVI
jgi:hypothetical protein